MNGPLNGSSKSADIIDFFTGEKITDFAARTVVKTQLQAHADAISVMVRDIAYCGPLMTPAIRRGYVAELAEIHDYLSTLHDGALALKQDTDNDPDRPA